MVTDGEEEDDVHEGSEKTRGGWERRRKGIYKRVITMGGRKGKGKKDVTGKRAEKGNEENERGKEREKRREIQNEKYADDLFVRLFVASLITRSLVVGANLALWTSGDKGMKKRKDIRGYGELMRVSDDGRGKESRRERERERRRAEHGAHPPFCKHSQGNM